MLAGGEDDLVHVWSMDDQKIVAWGEGHSSWVSGVAFDSYWQAQSSDEIEENVMHRFGSVGQDTRVLLWDLVMDEIAVPLRCPPGGSPTFSGGSPTFHSGSPTPWDNISPIGTLQPAPSMRDVPKFSHLVAHHAHIEPLSGLVFTNEFVLTICREGQIKVWVRPGHASDNSQSSNAEANALSNATNSTTSKDRSIFPSVKAGIRSNYKQSPTFT